MIVNYTADGWQIITQRAHGLLAAQLCAQWRKDNRPRRWIETLIATAEHDDVFNEFENACLLNPSGGPVDFKTTHFNQVQAQQLMDMAETKSAFIALLTSRHIRFVHGADKQAQHFLKSLTGAEKKWIKIAGSTVAEVDFAYDLLQFCDALSLVLCQNLIPPEGRKLEISKGPGKLSYEIYAAGQQLIIEPWPFEDKAITINYEFRTLSQLTFANTEDFRTAMKSVAPLERLQEIRKASTQQL